MNFRYKIIEIRTIFSSLGCVINFTSNFMLSCFQIYFLRNFFLDNFYRQIITICYSWIIFVSFSNLDSFLDESSRDCENDLAYAFKGILCKLSLISLFYSNSSWFFDYFMLICKALKIGQWCAFINIQTPQTSQLVPYI